MIIDVELKKFPAISYKLYNIILTENVLLLFFISIAPLYFLIAVRAFFKPKPCPGEFTCLERALDEILSFGEKNEILYREILERSDVYRESERGWNLLIIWLKHLPFGIRLKIKSAGKGEDYYTDVLEAELVNEVADSKKGARI